MRTLKKLFKLSYDSHFNEKWRSSPSWLNAKRLTLKRDHYTCQNCRITKAELADKQYLEIHHIHDASTYSQLKYVLRNLVVLCTSCHQSFHRWMGGNHVSCTDKDFQRWLKKEHAYRNSFRASFWRFIKRLFA